MAEEERMPLGDILSGAERQTPEPEAPKAEAPKTEAAPEPAPGPGNAEPAGQPRRADGTFAGKDAPKTDPAAEQKAEAKTEPAKPEPPKQEFTPQERAFLRAAEEERGKRQALERELAQYRQAPNQPEPPKPFAEDPDGALQRHQSTTEQAMMAHTIRVADMTGRARFQDYDQKAAAFVELARQDPRLVGALAQAPDPAAFAYGIGKQALDRQEWDQAGGAEGMRKKLAADMEKDIRTKVEAEYAEKERSRQEKIDALPGTLSDVQGRGGSGRPVWSGPAPLADILKH